MIQALAFHLLQDAPDNLFGRGVSLLGCELETLRGGDVRVEVIFPDEATEAPFASVGGNVLDPSVREGAARAGREQGRGAAALVGTLWL